MLTDYITTSYDFTPGAGLRIRRLGVQVLLGVFFLCVMVAANSGNAPTAIVEMGSFGKCFFETSGCVSMNGGCSGAGCA